MNLLNSLGVAAIALCAMTVNANQDVVVKDYSGQVYMDQAGKYFLKWNIDFTRKTMYFNITCYTTGYVGMGFSKDGRMTNADLVVAGVSPQGKPYITDYYTDCERNYKRDNKQSWNLLGATESGGRTVVYISRLIDTCDSEDYPITDDLVHIIWSYGYTDAVDYHYEHRGSYRVYLLDYVLHPSPLANSAPRWRASSVQTIPPKRTTYWCTMYKVPSGLRTKQHIIEIYPYFENKLAYQHVHHFVLYRCSAPVGSDARSTFESLIISNYPGEECYFNNNPKMNIMLCRTIVYFWSLGGQPLILPDHVGIPFAESGENEYYLLETMYDNPENCPGITFDTGVEAIYTDKLRANDAGGFLAAYDLFGLIIIPPAQDYFEVNGLCGTDCTSEMIPSSGIEIFAVHLHTHSSARKVKLHHHRNGRELSWIMKDDNYDHRFQQARPAYRKVLPGDQLTMSCAYDFWNATMLSGFSAFNKMCVAMIYHVTPIPYFLCVSQVAQDKLLKQVGVTGLTWDMTTQERVVTSPSFLAGQTLQQVCDNFYWTRKRRDTQQAITIGSTQIEVCPSITVFLQPPEPSPPPPPPSPNSTPIPDVMPGKQFSADYPFTYNPFARVRYCSAY